MWRAAGAGRGHEIWVCRRCQRGGGVSSVSEERAFVCEARGRTEGDGLPFCGKPGRMTDLAPDGRARLAGKKGTGIGKVRGEGGDFLRETKRRAACPERKLAFNSGEGGSGKKGARLFCRKRAARRKRMSACGRGILREKERAYIGRSGREQSGKPQYAAAATAGERRTSL